MTDQFADVRDGRRRFVFWDRMLWWRTYREGGFDGYRTLAGRRLPCGAMETALRCPDLAAEAKRASRRSCS